MATMGHRTGRGLAAALAVAILAATAMVTGVAGAGPRGAPHRSAPEVVVEDAARGLVYSGLRFSSPDGPCAGVRFEMRDPSGRLVGCTHGPDAAPDGVDVRARQSVADLRVRTAAGGRGTTPCIGNGTSGNRIQAIYAYRQGGTSHFASVAPLIRTWAGQVSAVYNASAAETG